MSLAAHNKVLEQELTRSRKVSTARLVLQIVAY